MNRPFTAGLLRRALVVSVLSVPAFASASVPARAAVINANDILDQFNAVVSNNFSTTSDVEGRLVAGNISHGATFFSNPNPLSSPSSFQAVNALTISGCSGCNINNGGSVNFITSNSGTYNFNGGGSLKQNMPMFMMSDFTTPLNALQTQLSALTANSTVTGNLAFNVTPHNGVAVFDISASELETANSNITFTNETSATTIIINVTGGNFTENGGTNFNGDTYLAEHAIWNFGSASSVSVKQWLGAVLAGDATVSNSSPINGFLYAENFAGQGELHDFPFQGTLPGTVPEASTWAMMAIGFGGLGFLGLRRRTAVAA